MKKILGIWLLVAAVIICGYQTYEKLGEKSDAPPPPPTAQTSSGAQNSPTAGKETHRPDGLRYIREIDASMEGQNTVTTGTVTRIGGDEEDGHVFFTLTDTKSKKSVRCVLFAKTNKDHPEYNELVQKSKDSGSAVYVEGKVNIYKGKLQIIAWKVFAK